MSLLPLVCRALFYPSSGRNRGQTLHALQYFGVASGSIIGFEPCDSSQAWLKNSFVLIQHLIQRGIVEPENLMPVEPELSQPISASKRVDPSFFTTSIGSVVSDHNTLAANPVYLTQV